MSQNTVIATSDAGFFISAPSLQLRGHCFLGIELGRPPSVVELARLGTAPSGIHRGRPPSSAWAAAAGPSSGSTTVGARAAGSRVVSQFVSARSGLDTFDDAHAGSPMRASFADWVLQVPLGTGDLLLRALLQAALEPRSRPEAPGPLRAWCLGPRRPDHLLA